MKGENDEPSADRRDRAIPESRQMTDERLDEKTERAIRWFKLSVIGGTEPDCAGSEANLRSRIRELVEEARKDAFEEGLHAE